MRTRKPKLASGERIVVDTHGSGTPGLGSHNGVVSTATSTEALPRRAARAVLGFAVLGLVMAFLTYAVLASTVFVVLRANHHNVAVLRNTFPIGQAPADAVVYVSSSPADVSFTGKINQAIAGVPAGSVVQIVAGPIGEVATGKDGHLLINGKPTRYTVQPGVSRTLVRQYLALCIAGACQPGKAVVVEQNNIVGEVKGYLSTSGLSQPPIAQP